MITVLDRMLVVVPLSSDLVVHEWVAGCSSTSKILGNQCGFARPFQQQQPAFTCGEADRVDQEVREIEYVARIRDQYPLTLIRQRLPEPLSSIKASLFSQHFNPIKNSTVAWHNHRAVQKSTDTGAGIFPFRLGLLLRANHCYSIPFAASHLSASRAAMHPVPAAVIA